MEGMTVHISRKYTSSGWKKNVGSCSFNWLLESLANADILKSLNVHKDLNLVFD